MISVTILTKNSEKYLREVLYSLQSFDEVLIGDTGSSDNTLEIAFQFKNVKVILIPFEGFGKTHNRLVEHAKNDWILSIDSDEVPEKGLISEIYDLHLNPNEAYSIPRKNFYKGTWVKSCGWYPDRVLRLYNRKRTQFSSHDVHEAVISEGLSSIDLRNHLEHYPYEKVSDFLAKMQLYTDLFARQNKGRAASYWTAIFHAKFAFFRSYILKGGFKQGGIGFEISMYNAITAFYKYMKLKEINISK